MITTVATVTRSSADDDRPPGVHSTAPASSLTPARWASEPLDVGTDDRMRTLCREHSNALLRYLIRLTLGDRDLAEDLLQETLLRAWRNLPGLAADVQTLRPWLYTVAKRIAIDNARARAARPREVHAGDFTTIAASDNEMDRVVVVETVRKSLANLSAAHRQVLVELYYRGRPVAAVAKDLGIPEGTVKSRVHYALRAVRRAIDEG